MTNSEIGYQNRFLLVSMPQLKDPSFSQTITLITEFSKEGAMGLILNRPLNVALDQVLKATEDANSAKGSNVRLYWGGPVQNDRGWILHEDSLLTKESLEIEPGLYLSSSETALQKLLTSTSAGSARYRFFLGYAGWAPGQLEQEMAGGSWMALPMKKDFLFDENTDSLWERSIQTIGITPANLTSTPQGNLH